MSPFGVDTGPYFSTQGCRRFADEQASIESRFIYNLCKNNASTCFASTVCCRASLHNNYNLTSHGYPDMDTRRYSQTRISSLILNPCHAVFKHKAREHANLYSHLIKTLIAGSYATFDLTLLT